jgi:hypothetical protein
MFHSEQMSSTEIFGSDIRGLAPFDLVDRSGRAVDWPSSDQITIPRSVQRLLTSSALR